MKFLDEYFAKSKHTNKERKKYSDYMETQYKKYLKTYHDVKVKYRAHTADKMTFKEFKEVYRNEYLISHSTKDTNKALMTRENLLTIETPDIDRYFKMKEQNFNRNLEAIKKKLQQGKSATQLEQLMLQVDKERRYQKRDFLWQYSRLMKLANNMGIVYERAYDSPDEELEEA